MMKKIILLRHAKSDWGDPSLVDFDRPLSPRGIKDAPGIGQALKDEGLYPTYVSCSPARRTIETWKRLHEKWGEPVTFDLEEAIYMAGPATLLGLIQRIDDSHDTVMLIGHNPGMHLFARQLIANANPPDQAKLTAKFPTGAMASLWFDVTRFSDIRLHEGRLDLLRYPRDGQD